MKFTVSSYKNIKVPYYGKSLLNINDDVIGFLGENNGRKIAALGFDIHNSDVALKKEFPIFIYELGEQLIESGLLYKYNYKSGEDIVIKGTPQAESLEVISPSKKVKEIMPGSNYNNVNEIGVYRVIEKQSGKENSKEAFSINFPSDSESNVSSDAVSQTSNLENETKTLRKGLSLLPLLLLLALIGLITEYILYLKGN